MPHQGRYAYISTEEEKSKWWASDRLGFSLKWKPAWNYKHPVSVKGTNIYALCHWCTAWCWSTAHVSTYTFQHYAASVSVWTVCLHSHAVCMQSSSQGCSWI
jgi:hypothetical protein